MTWMTQPLSPEFAKRFYGSNPTELKRFADDTQVYLDHLRRVLAEGPPDVDPSLGLNPEKLNAAWRSNLQWKIAEAEESVVAYAELVDAEGEE